MKEVTKIIAYFAAVVLLGALLAPLLFWAGNALASHGMLTFLGDVTFQRYFDRAVLVAAMALLWPMVRWLQIGGWRDLGIESDPRWRQHALAGFVIGGVLVGAMACAYTGFGFYEWRSRRPWGALPPLLISALTVGLLEESLFRGAIFGLFRKSLRPFTALFSVTAIFAIVHFLKPDPQLVVERVSWLSGFVMLGHVFHQFGEPMTVLAGFSTIFALGWVLGYATLRTRSLWMSIGLHAGVVFVKMSFGKLARRDATLLPWIGSEFQIGLVPVIVLLFGGVLVWLWLRHEDSAPHR